MAISLFVHACGFVKTLLIACWFGASAAVDGYYLALVIPTVLVGVVTGAMQAGFVPVYLETRQRGEAQQADDFVRQLGTLLLISLALLGALVYLSADRLAELLVWSEDPEVLAYATRALPVVALVLVLNAAVDFLCLVLSVNKRFALAALSPLSGLLVSSAFLFFTPRVGFDALIFGPVAGCLTQLMLLLGGVLVTGVNFRPALPRATHAMRRSLSLAGLMFLGLVFANLNTSIDQMMASSLKPAAVSQLGYASRFHGIVVQIFVMGTGTALFPYLADMVVSNRVREIVQLFRDLALLLVFVAVTVTLGVLLLGPPLLDALLNHGEMTRSDTLSIAGIWFYYALGALPMGWGVFLARYFQSVGKPWFITQLAATATVANVLLGLPNALRRMLAAHG